MPEENINTAQTAVVYSTVKQFCQRHPAFKEGGLRYEIFHAETNGLKKSGAIVRNGRKVLIVEPRYFARLEALNNQGGAK
jgi:hypothetical protein